MPDLDQLREVGLRVRQPAFDEIVATRRRRTRRAQVAAGSSLASALVVVATALASLGQADRSVPDPVAPTPTPTPTFEIPSGQETLVPDIEPGDVAGFDVVATLTTEQPEHRGDPVLTTTFPDRGVSISAYCRGDVGLYYFYDLDDGSAGFDRCAPDATRSFVPPDDLGDGGAEDPVDPSDPSRTVRMWVARPTQEFLDCQHSNRGDCPRVEDVPPVSDPDAEYGFRLYGSPEVRSVLELPVPDGNGGTQGFRALVTHDGVPWLLDRAVMAAPDVSRLALPLEASDTPRLVDVYADDGDHRERCRTRRADDLPSYEHTDSRDYWAAVDRLCGFELRLVVDGRVVGDLAETVDGTEALRTVLPAGSFHQVEVEVVRGDPRDLRFAVVLHTRTQLP